MSTNVSTMGGHSARNGEAAKVIQEAFMRDEATRNRGQRIVVALFRDREDATSAIRELHGSGFSREQIGVAMRDRSAEGRLVEETGTSAVQGAAAGAVGGGVLGGLVGLLVGIGAIAIPGIGPVVAGGALASALGVPEEPRQPVRGSAPPPAGYSARSSGSGCPTTRRSTSSGASA